MLQPILQAQYLAMRRARKIAAIERERGSRVSTIIHRNETGALLGFPVSRLIDLRHDVLSNAVSVLI
jgi:Serine dehydrogenase proteinase